MCSTISKQELVSIEVLETLKVISIPKENLPNTIVWKLLAQDKWYDPDSKKLLVRYKVDGNIWRFALYYPKNIETNKEEIETLIASGNQDIIFNSKLWRRYETKRVCIECFQIFSEEDIILTEKHVICKKCFEAVSMKCANCHAKFYSNEMHRYQPNAQTSPIFFCRCCFDHLFAKCFYCSGVEPKDNMFVYRGKRICVHCKADRFLQCSGCTSWYPKEDMRTRIIPGTTSLGIFCRECFDDLATIKAYDYIPLKFNKNKLEWDNELYLGIELEIETNKPREKDEFYANATTEFLKSLGIDKLFYIKHDGTVQGFELVTHPATSQFLQKHVPWYKILNWFISQGFTSYKSRNCGLHVHLNKAFFNPLDVHKLRLFFSVNKVFIYKFSKRFGYNDRYCNYEELDPKEYIKKGKKQDGKYWAIRTCPNHKYTVEFRVFRGTLNYARFLASLQFCDALAHYIKMVSIVSCQNKGSWVNFIQWCQKSNNYNHFIKYIQNNAELEKPEI